MKDRGITIEHQPDRPNGWAVMAVSALVGLALVIIAIALFALANWVGVALATLANYIGWAALLVAGGQAAVQTCRGVSFIIEASGRARALNRRVDVYRLAVMRGRDLLPPPYDDSGEM